MSAQNSSRKPKASVGNGSYLPHMQSSLSPQGYGLYNSNGSNGTESPTGITSGSSPRLKEHAIPYNDYLIPIAPYHDTPTARGGNEHWNAMGNENFAACTSPGGSHPNGVGENGSVATARGFGGSFPQSQHQPLSHSGPTRSNQPLASYQALPLLNEPRRSPFNFPAPLSESTSIMGGSGDHADTTGAKSTAGPSLQNHSTNIAKNYYNGTPGGSYSNDKANGNQWVMPSMFDAKNSSREISSDRNPAPSYSSRNDASNFGTPRGGNVPLLKSQIYPNNVAARGGGGGSSRLDEVEMDRDRKKDRLIDSLSNSDMITCLPGFKKRAAVVPQRMKPIRPLKFHEDRFNDKVADQKAQQYMNYNIKSSTPLSTLSSSRGGGGMSSAYARCSPASLSPTLNYKDNAGIVGRGISNQNSALYNINSSRSDSRSCRPPSPVTRAQAAIGNAQNEISKIHSYVEEQEEKRRIPGSWQSMGTPFNTEPQTKSAQRQQKAQYRMDLERQILASKMRKAEEERKEKDNNDHPLGPEYAHPALTYYNPPHKIIGSPDLGASFSPTKAAAAITKYIKEKYALDVPGANTNGTTSGYPPETGGSSTALGRIAPLQQAKKEKALANLMKSRVHPKDTSRLLPMNQLQTGGARLHNGMMMHPGNGPKFPQQQLHSQEQQPQTFGQQQQQQAHASRPQQAGYPQYAYPPPGTYPSRGGGGGGAFGMPAAWPMPLLPAYAPSPYTPYGPIQNPYGHGQPIYPSANRGPLVNSQPVAQQQNYSHSPQLPPQPHLQQVLLDPRNQQQEQQRSQQAQAYAAYLAQQQNYFQHQNRNANGTQGELREPHQWNQGAANNYLDQEEIFHSRALDGDDDDLEEFETLKEQTCTNQKIWQTSDELPDPELRTAIYKAELRKQIDEDRRRKAERLAREKEEEERMERKISEFHAEEHQRVAMGQQTRAELEGYHRSKIQKKQKRNEVFTITRNPDRQQNEIRPRSKSSLLAAKLARYRPEAGDFEENLVDGNECYDYGVVNEYNHDKFPSSLANTITGSIHPLRKSSPPVPVVQKKLIEDLFIASSENRNRNLPHEISFDGQNFLIELKSKLSSERDLVERRLREKLESTKKNMNLLKYTMHQK